MKLTSPLRMAVLPAIPLFLLLAGCYSDPNISSEKRVRFPDDDPQTAAQYASATPSTPNPVTPTAPGIPALPPSAAPLGGTNVIDLFPQGGIGGGKIAIGDMLTILFSDVPPDALPKQMIIKVGIEGSITLPLNVTVQALGKTPTELERAIRAEYVPKYFVQCTPSVKAEERYFFVGGEVKVSSRQLYTSHSMTVLRAITTAGGFTDFATKKKIEVRRANGGKTEYVNYYKALKDPRLDLPVYPNDQVIVPRGL